MFFVPSLSGILGNQSGEDLNVQDFFDDRLEKVEDDEQGVIVTCSLQQITCMHERLIM